MTSPSILVVDDEPDARDLLADGLRVHGYEVATAADGEEAAAAIRSGTLAVILDLVMPRRDGIWLLGELSRRCHPAVRVVLTSFADRDRAIAALNAGADYLVEKPFTAARMVDLLGRLLRERADDHGIDRVFEIQLARLGLGDRDRRLVVLILKGMTNRGIAEVLGTSEQVVKNQTHHLYQRLGISSRGELFHLVFPI